MTFPSNQAFAGGDGIYRRWAERLEPLRSPSFIVAVAVLIANDLIFKSVWGNFITGKLSDVAGLWAFGYFFLVLTGWPRANVAILVAAVFALWKSPAVGPLIEAWNSVAWPSVGRVVDWTDLLALPVLGFLPRAFDQIRPVPLTHSRVLLNSVIAVAAFMSFVATQRVGDHACCGQAFEFAGTEAELVTRLGEIGAMHIRKHDRLSDARGTWYSITLPDKFCGSSVHASIQVREEAGKSQVLVRMLQYHCAEPADTVIQERFKQSILSKLNGGLTTR